METKGRKKSVFSKVAPKVVNKELELKKWLNRKTLPEGDLTPKTAATHYTRRTIGKSDRRAHTQTDWHHDLSLQEPITRDLRT